MDVAQAAKHVQLAAARPVAGADAEFLEGNDALAAVARGDVGVGRAAMADVNAVGGDAIVTERGEHTPAVFGRREQAAKVAMPVGDRIVRNRDRGSDLAAPVDALAGGTPRTRGGRSIRTTAGPATTTRHGTAPEDAAGPPAVNIAAT